ncbi:nitroreductase [Fodinicurvata sp. EGI_FJ10296]|uniref:nitroreductase n=1 Tax=Fodinicurvata sp. EGI_FJ10296 TaxID=3231908 RepID=UPI0034543A20
MAETESETGRELVHGAITSRRSVRGFTDAPVSADVVRRLLDVARHAPSGSNMQPWKAHVVTGAALSRLSNALMAAHDSGEPAAREYDYYPQTWREPYLARRRKVGWQLYEQVGIARGDREASRRWHGRNYEFFGAPVGMIFSIDRDLGQGSLIDFGMFLQSLMIAARGEGLDTCPQAALANYPAILRDQLSIPEDELILCGLSLGHADPNAPANRFRAEREPVEAFARFHDV